MAQRTSKGKFITVEGLDGCGKSTQLERLANALRGEGIDALVTREPGGTPVGEKLRAVVLDSRTAGLSPLAELAILFASRAQHIFEIILPAVQAGKWVLCDRFTDSSEAYQGGGRELGSEAVLTLHRVLCGDLHPDLTILMDSDVAASVARARRRNSAAKDSSQIDENRFEQENKAFFTRVRNKYLEIAKREPQRVAVVDARRTADVVHPEILNVVRNRLLEVAVDGNGRLGA